MSEPDRIWVWPHFEGVTGAGSWSESKLPRYPEYIRRDPAVLAALPEVRELIEEAFNEGWNDAIEVRTE